MGKTYSKCPQEVVKIGRKVLEQHHPELAKAEVSIDYLFVFSVDGHALFLHGYACLAVVKKMSLKNRAKGMADAEITIDQTTWNDLSHLQREALLDHELEHLELVTKNNQVQRDSLKRPKLSMRLHDWELGGFAATARRYKNAAPEVRAAQEFKEVFGQYVFDFAAGEKAA